MAFASSILPRTTQLNQALCPFHDGPETLDGLLAGLNGNEADLMDACLDLRSLMTAGAEAETCLEQVCRIRQLLDGRHHLAFYRVRAWLRRAITVEVRRHRSESWQRQALPLDFARVDELVHRFTAPFARHDEVPASFHLRFSFTEGARSASA